MPTSAEDVFKSLSGPPPGAMPPQAPDPPETAPRANSPEAIFASLPKPPTMKERAGAAVAKVGKAASAALWKMAATSGDLVDPEADLYTPEKRAKSIAAYMKGEVTQAPSVVAGIAAAKDAWSQFKEDLADPAAESEPLHGLKTAMDAAFVVTAPFVEGGRAAFARPLQATVTQVTNLLAEAASPDEAKKKGIDWKVHKREILDAGKDTNQLLDAAYDFATLLIPGPKGMAAVRGEQEAARARLALRDVEAAIAPTEPKLTPVAVSIDKNLGFGKVNDVVGAELKAYPPGTVKTSGELIDKMIPHAEGYAKSFLTKLKEHMNPNVSVAFKEVAGQEGYAGIYIPDHNRIEIRVGGDPRRWPPPPESGGIVNTAVHEIVHSNTLYMVDTLVEEELRAARAAKGAALTEDEIVQAVSKPKSPILKELDAIIREADIRAQKAGRRDFYATKAYGPPPSGASAYLRSFHQQGPRYEFLAELFHPGNEKFVEFLANSEKYASAGYKWKNMLNQLGNLIGRHLGLKGPHELQLLNQAMRMGTRLIEMQERAKSSPRHIYDIIAKVNEGETITVGDMNKATAPMVGKLIEGAGVRKAKSALGVSIEGFLRNLNPEALGRNAKLAAAVISSGITRLEQRTSFYKYGSRTREKFWRARPDMKAEFIEKFEKGENFSDPVLRRLAEKYRAWGKEIFENDMKRGFTYEERDNYLFHSFEDSEGLANHFARKYGSKWGDPSFTKERSFDLYKEAIAAGFRPRFDNPEDIMLARQHASDIAEMHAGILDDLASFGLATRKIEGGERIVKDIDKEGKVTFRVEKIEGTKQPEGTTRWRSPTGDVFWVDNQAQAVLHNAFLSKSLWSAKGLGGMGFRGMMTLKNLLVPVRLALSGFHPLHVTGIDIAAGWTRASAELMSGSINPVTWMGKMLASGANPIVEAVSIPFGKGGWRVVKAWKGAVKESELTEADREALKILVETGIAPEMSAVYRTNARENFGNAMRDAMASFRQVRPIGAAGDLTRAAWHAPWALLSAMNKPIFEQWIPSLKAASAIKDAKSLLARNPELMENEAQRRLAMRRIGKSVDNRYGEMAYNKLFWNRWMKDVAVLDTLSLGWQLGFIREYGGGTLELGQFARGGERIARIRRGEMDKAIFVANYTTLGAGVAGLMTWAFTGEQPTGMDFINPRTGEKNPDGSDQRVTTMFYSREFASLYKHIQAEGAAKGVSDLVLNKGSGLFGLMHEWGTGLNGFGVEIRDPKSDLFQQVEQTLAYSMADLEPISMKSIHDTIGGAPTKTKVLTGLGFAPEPKYMSESVAVAHIKSAFRNFVAPKETPFEKAEYSKDYSKLREAYQSGSEEYGELLDKMSQQFELSGKDQRRIIRSLNSEVTPAMRMFISLGRFPEQQKRLLDEMTPEEREVYLPHANKEKVRNVYVPPEDRE